MTSLDPTIRRARAISTPIRLAWRVGASGRLDLEIELRAERDHPFSGLGCCGLGFSGHGFSDLEPSRLEVSGSWRLVRGGSVESGRVVGTASIHGMHDGTDAEVEAELRLDGRPAPEVAVLSIARARSRPVVLTDLPARLGLSGGTYVLDAEFPGGLLPDR